MKGLLWTLCISFAAHAYIHFWKVYSWGIKLLSHTIWIYSDLIANKEFSDLNCVHQRMRVPAAQYSHQHVVLPVSFILPFWLKGLANLQRDLNSAVNIFETFTYVKGAFHLDMKKNSFSHDKWCFWYFLGQILDLLEF